MNICPTRNTEEVKPATSGKVHKVKAMPYQKTVLKSRKKFIFMGAGVGAGKTFIGALWSFKKILLPGKQVGLIASNSYTQMSDTTVTAIYALFDAFNIQVTPPKPPRCMGPFDCTFSVNGDQKLIRFRSLLAYENISGMEIDWFWLDEVWQATKDALDIVFARLRGKSPLLQGLLTTTLDDPSCWLYEFFVENYDEKIMDVVYATSYDNTNLPEGYIDALKASYSARLFDRMVLAKWVVLESDIIYYNFSRNKHVHADIEYEPRLPISISFDFNIGAGKPASLVIAQMRKAGDRRVLFVLDELVVQGLSTDMLLEELFSQFGQKYNFKNHIVYGDATGKARDSTSNRSDYDIILANGLTNLKVPSVNPLVRHRHNVMNSVLLNKNEEASLFIHPRCKTVIRGLELTKLKKGAMYSEDDSDFYQHITTALGYLVCVEFVLPNTNRLSKFAI